MFYTSDPAADWNSYCRYHDRLRQEEIIEEIQRLERKLEDYDAFLADYNDYGEDIDEDEYFKIWSEEIEDEINKLNKEYENRQW